MISLDSNVVISYLNPADANHTPALSALKANDSQGFVLAPPVYTELRASAYWPTYHAWLRSSGIGVLWDMPEAVWELAGQRFLRYIQTRRKSHLPRGIVADFLIAAHAEHHSLDVMSFDSLDVMSFDRTVYDGVFPAVTLIEPT